MAEPTLSDVMAQLVPIRAQLVTIELEQRQQTALLTAIIQGQQLMANQYDALVTALNDNTNAVSARLDRLISQLGANITPDQTATLQAISDHLKALGQDPTTPVPPVPVALA